MLDIKMEIEIALLKRGLSMRKLISRLNESEIKITKSSTISSQLRSKRIRFETVQQILDYLGYELVIREKK